MPWNTPKLNNETQDHHINHKIRRSTNPILLIYKRNRNKEREKKDLDQEKERREKKNLRTIGGKPFRQSEEPAHIRILQPLGCDYKREGEEEKQRGKEVERKLTYTESERKKESPFSNDDGYGNFSAFLFSHKRLRLHQMAHGKRTW